MQEKKAISLIVLVITIIVMIILAGTVIISISNNGIIQKAQEAVDKTNLKQIEQLASLAWAEAYAEGAKTQSEFETKVKEKMKNVDTTKYSIIVTVSGVTVKVKTNVEPSNIAAGLYQTGSNYTVLLKDWDTLLNEGIIHVEDGVVYTDVTSSGTDITTIENSSSTELAGDLVIPNDGSVTALGNFDVLSMTGLPAFAGCQYLTNVIIPEGVTDIAAGAFTGNTMLTSIDIPTTVSHIGILAFGGTNVQSIAIESTTITIDMLAFSGCENLRSVNFKADEIQCSADVFASCINLRKANFDCNELTLTYLGRYYLFSGLPGITSVGHGDEYDLNLPVNTQFEFESDGSAFGECINLKKVNLEWIPLTEYYGSFTGCTSLTSIGPGEEYDCVLYERNTYFWEAFDNCTGLTTVVLPEWVTLVEASFSNCTNLKTVYIPVGVTSLSNSFVGCTSLTDIYYAGTEEQWANLGMSGESLNNATIHYNYVLE